MSQATTTRPNDLPPAIAQALNDFLAVLEDTFGERLVSAVLFGSAAEGRVRATCDVNLAGVARTYTRGDAERLREPLTLAHAAIALNVMFLVEDELGAAAEAFAAKFADIRRRRPSRSSMPSRPIACARCTWPAAGSSASRAGAHASWTITSTTCPTRCTPCCGRSRDAPCIRSPWSWSATGATRRSRTCWRSWTARAALREGRRDTTVTRCGRPPLPPRQGAIPQAVLARLYVDDQARERFLADPAAEARALGLAPDQAGSLAAIDREGLRLAASSFARKRDAHGA